MPNIGSKRATPGAPEVAVTGPRPTRGNSDAHARVTSPVRVTLGCVFLRKVDIRGPLPDQMSNNGAVKAS